MTEFLDIWNLKKRGKLDSARHKRRIKKAIKENLKDLVSESNIISSDGKRKVKIPIKYLDNYRFKHASNPNQDRVGQGDGNPGDILGHDGTGKPGGGKGAGSESGEDVYEEEVEIEEIINIMLEDLNLPWLHEKERAVEVETDSIVFDDISEVGPLSNIDRRATIKENIKRNAKKGKPEIGNFHNDDLRYKVWDNEIEHRSNAAVYMLMDRSGSMTDEKKYIAKSMFFWIVHFCRTKYSNVDIVFVAHTSDAKVVPEEDFFKISNSGGTQVSSAFELTLEHIKKNHDPAYWNNYVIEVSDGDNFPSDNAKCVNLVEELLGICSAVGYIEVDTDSIFGGNSIWGFSTLHEEFDKMIDNPQFLSTVISSKEDIYKALQDFFGSGDV